jgi:hypothetical protein
MKPTLFVSVLLLLPAWVIADDAPAKITVQQLLAQPDKYDHHRVDVSGYYTTSMEDSDLWPDKATSERTRGLEGSIYIDPTVWDPRYTPKKPKDVMDVDALRFRRVRVIGTFRAGGVRGRIAIPPNGPTIVDVTYFRPIRLTKR